MDLSLSGMTVLVTGASGGIGRALAETFAAEHAQLVLHAHAGIAELERWVAARPWADRATCLAGDVSDPDDATRIVEAGIRRFGGVDVCIANAGIWPPEALPLHQLPVARIRQVIDVNLLGALYTARAFLAGLARIGPRADGRGASLLFVGSTAGRFGEKGHAEYAVSKTGLYGLLRTLKNEIVALDPYGRVNLVEPGWTVTPMAREALADAAVLARAVATMPVQQLARPVDIARVAAFLSSPAAARHVSGEVITVAGGMEGRQQWAAGDIDAAAIMKRVDEPE